MLIFLLVVGAVAVVLFVRSANRSSASRQLSLTPVHLPAGERVEVVGESYYQPAIERVAGPKTDESKWVPVVATLVSEPSNRHDRNAVAIYIEGRHVGHLGREDAREFQPFLNQLSARGEVATCDALIVGGWDRGARGQGFFGVRLDVQRPSARSRATEVIVDAAPLEFDLEAVANRLRHASGPAARRGILAKALRGLEPADRAALLLQASRVEVEAVLAKVDGLKTVAAKRRNLEAALKALQEDEVSDELQLEQIAWLRSALDELEAA